MHTKAETLHAEAAAKAKELAEEQDECDCRGRELDRRQQAAEAEEAALELRRADVERAAAELRGREQELQVGRPSTSC